MTVLSLITCNLRGVQSIKNREAKISALHNTNYDIICAQELRLTSQADVEDVRARWEKGTSIVSRGCDRADGVAIYF